MTNLFLYKLKNQFKLLLPIMGISLIVTFFWYLTSLSDNTIMQILAKLLSAAAFITTFLPLTASVVYSWFDFYNTFFGRRAYLIRTLPFSRGQLFGITLANDIFCLILSILWPVLVLGGTFCLADETGFAELFLEEWGKFIVLFLVALVCQALFIEQCGFTGGLFGFRMKESHLPWSVGIGILTYFVGNLVMTPAIFIYLGGDVNNPALAEESISGLLWLIIGVYLVVNLILLILDLVLVRGRTDVE